jgi:hypothetical protein
MHFAADKRVSFVRRLVSFARRHLSFARLHVSIDKRQAHICPCHARFFQNRLPPKAVFSLLPFALYSRRPDSDSTGRLRSHCPLSGRRGGFPRQLPARGDKYVFRIHRLRIGLSSDVFRIHRLRIRLSSELMRSL